MLSLLAVASSDWKIVITELICSVFLKAIGLKVNNYVHKN